MIKANEPAAATYDVHTHVGLDQAFWLAGWWPYAATAQDLIERMDAGGVDRAVCFPFCVASAFDAHAFGRDRSLALLPGRFPYDVENPALITEIDRLDLGDRLLPLAMFDPGRQVDEQLTALRGLAGRITGIKTQTTVLRSPIRALLGEARGLMAFAAEHDLPVLFHTAIAPHDQWAQVEDCLAVAEAWPGVRFNLAHSLRFDRPSLERAAQLPNVWIDCSAHLVHCQLAVEDSPAVAARQRRVDADYANPSAVLETIHAMLGGRYLWGSDNPFMSWCDDGMSAVLSYAEEVAALRALPATIQRSMTHTAPQAWLYGVQAEKDPR